MNADKSDSSLVHTVGRGAVSLSVLAPTDSLGSMSIADSASIPAPRCPRYRSLDAWRGIACLLVIVAHSSNYGTPDEPWALSRVTYWLWATCHRFWIGVPIFFVISGYCISATADATRRKGRPATDYFLRRFRRIFPPFWVWFLFSALVVGVSNWWSPQFLQDGNVGIAGIQTLSVWQILGNLTLTESWRPWVVGDQTRFFLGHTWTLAYEEQFYVVVGAILWMSRKRFFAAALFVSVLTAALVVVGHMTSRVILGGTFLDGKWLHFAAGIAVYFSINHASRMQAILVWLMLILGLGIAARDPFYLLLTRPSDFDQSSFVAYSFALILLAAHRWDATIAQSRLAAPLMYCGTLCYSLYLVHWPLVKFVSKACYLFGARDYTLGLLITVPVCIAASILVAIPFHQFIERRFLNRPQN